MNAPESAQSIPMSYQSSGSQMPQYIEWILASPSIPMQLRDEFFMMWELAPLGNYQNNDIPVLMAKFDEWRIHWIMAIPDKNWGRIEVYKDTPDGKKLIRMDINTIMDMLWSLYYIQLTRGRDAKTLESLNTQWVHSDSRQEMVETQKKKGGLRLF